MRDSGESADHASEAAETDGNANAAGDAGLDPAAVRSWLSLSPPELLKRCRQSRFQGSGPGGQKRNRVYSGVRLIHPESGLTAECVDSRDSARNVAEALTRLRLALALAAVPVPPRQAHGPANSGPDPAPIRLVEGVASLQPFKGPREAETGAVPASGPRSAVRVDPAPGSAFRAGANPGHPDYALGALRALLHLARAAGRVSDAAEGLACSPSALTRFLKADKAVWTRAREIRLANGLHPLK